MRNLTKGDCSHSIWTPKFDLSTNNSGMWADEVDTEGNIKRVQNSMSSQWAAGRVAAIQGRGKRRGTNFHLPKSESKDW